MSCNNNVELNGAPTAGRFHRPRLRLNPVGLTAATAKGPLSHESAPYALATDSRPLQLPQVA